MYVSYTLATRKRIHRLRCHVGLVSGDALNIVGLVFFNGYGLVLVWKRRVSPRR